MPPEKVLTVESRRSHSPTIFRTCRIRGLDELGLDPVQLGVQLQVLLGGQVRVDRLVLEDEADVAADVVALAHDVVSRDLSACRPIGRLSVHSMLIVVLFPAPLGPRKPKTSPAATSNETPRTASNAPKRLTRPWTEMAAPGAAPLLAGTIAVTG